MPKVAILDDLAVAESLSIALDSAEDISSTGFAGTLEEFASLIGRARPDVALVDIAADNASQRLAVCELPAVREANAKVFFLSRHDRGALMEAARRAGAAGFLLKSTPLSTLADAIKVVAAGGTVFVGGVASAAGMIQPPTDREIVLLRALASGDTNVAAGHALGISSRTVESHLRRLFARYGVASRLQLLMLAVREGWVSLDESKR